ncbi:hypothetical protein AgCh_015815 [Apium graveolens]
MQVSKLDEINKGNIYIAITSSPSVIRAYHQQFQKDFTAFLKCRSEEMVTAGRMVLTIIGRRSDDPTSKECCLIWELLSVALRDMVSQGLIEEKKLDEFNIPQYNPYPGEVKQAVENKGLFSIDRLDVSQVKWIDRLDVSQVNNVHEDEGAYNITKCIRSEIIADTISKETTQLFSVIVSVIKS